MAQCQLSACGRSVGVCPSEHRFWCSPGMGTISSSSALAYGLLFQGWLSKQGFLLAVPHDLSVGLQVVWVEFGVAHVDLQVTFDVLHFGITARNSTLHSHMVTTTLLIFFWCFFVFTIFLGIFFLHFNFICFDSIILMNAAMPCCLSTNFK